MTKHVAARLGRLLSGLLLVVFVGATAVPVQGGEDHLVYLPLVLKTIVPQGLWGDVTDDGVPASGVALDLYRESPGDPPYVEASTTTQADGQYVFAGVAALPVDDRYVVIYSNTTDSSRLRRITTRRIDAYAPGDSVHVADFDLANLPLEAPGDGAAVVWPAWFSWTERPATPTDLYMLAFFDMDGVNLLGSGAVSWNSDYVLTDLPPGLSYTTRYQWNADVLMPGGTFGLNFDMREVCFGSCPALAGAPTPLILAPLAP